ncbi:MAG: coaD [Clostridia bacterium]|nr:coaD [Clostridia bacterium]
MKDKIVICPGSFDPITKGHVDMILRANKLFDVVYVVIMINSAKKPVFTEAERLDMCKKVFEEYPQIKVISCEGLLAGLVKSLGACTLIKGVRNITDFNYEFELAFINRNINAEIETVFIPTKQEYMFLSSYMVREVGHYGGDISGFVPECICDFATEKLNNYKE